MLTPLLRLAWLLVLVMFATSAHASQKAAAESLFQEGKRLMDAGRHEEACPKFEASHKAEPSVGAMLNLARCHEVIGKTASAWAEYLEAARLAREAGQSDREQGARELASKIEPKLSKLTIVVDGASNGLTVKRNKNVVPEQSWGVAVPVDPGPHTIEASAPGKRTWSETVTIGDNGDAQTVTVPALENVEDRSTASSGGPNELALAGYVIGAFGVVVLGLGTAAGIVAIEKEEELSTLCDPPGQCSEQDLIEETELIADLATAGIAVGAACLAGGIILVILGHTSGEAETTRIHPHIGPSQAGIGISGRF